MTTPGELRPGASERRLAGRTARVDWAVVVSAFALLSVVAGVASASGVHPSSPFVLAIDQSHGTTAQSTFTVSVEVADPSAVRFAFFTFCQLTSPVCYTPVVMSGTSGSNWLSGTTQPMTSYPGMTPGVRAGYNISLDLTNGTNLTEPTTPNPFTNLTVTPSVSGVLEFEMGVQNLSYGLGGTVSDGSTGHPIAGATVALTPGTNSTITNSQGSYSFSGIFNGTYHLTVTAAGYPTNVSTATVDGQSLVDNVLLGNVSGNQLPPPSKPAHLNGFVGFFESPPGFAAIAGIGALLALGAVGITRRSKGKSDPVEPSSETSPAAGTPSTPPKDRRKMRRVAMVVLIAVAVGATGFLGYTYVLAPTSSGPVAPAFSLTDIYGHPFVLSNYRTSDVVMVEFTSLTCSECQIVEKTLFSLYAGYNSTGSTHVELVSVFTNPQFGDTVPALKSYHDSHGITWAMAPDTSALTVQRAYHVSEIPDVFIVDKKGDLVYQQTGGQSSQTLSSKVSQSLAGTAAPISLVTVSVFGLAAIAGVTTFFSPCAFPMFPGYMSLFLGLNTTKASATPGSDSGEAYKGAARRAAFAGSATAIGMMLVFLVIGVVLLLAANAVRNYIPDLLLIVAGILIFLGGLLLTNLQYWRVVTPFQRLWARLRGKDGSPAPITAASASGEGLYLKLFGYGVGYAAAAAGCVAPVILSAVVGGLALGFVGGIATILIYSLTAALLMIFVTIALAMASQRFINKLKAATPVIKKISAVALIVVGVYLVYYFGTAWGFTLALLSPP